MGAYYGAAVLMLDKHPSRPIQALHIRSSPTFSGALQGDCRQFSKGLRSFVTIAKKDRITCRKRLSSSFSWSQTHIWNQTQVLVFGRKMTKVKDLVSSVSSWSKTRKIPNTVFIIIIDFFLKKF